MAHYFVGDVQGCFAELICLMEKVDFNPSRDELWSVGDLVARGPDSLKVLELFCQLGNSAKAVLGNHDLHLLSLLSGLKQAKPADKLQSLILSAKVPEFIDFIRHQPLMRELPEHQLVMSHAGVPPQWTLEDLRSGSELVSKALLRPDYLQSLISKMYSPKPELWNDNLQGIDRLRYCINALTRMRYLHSNGSLDFDSKMPESENTNEDLKPWFKFSSKLPNGTKIVFGHWAALMGITNHKDRLALDTGCCWNEYMTLWHLETDEKIIQPCLS